MLLGWSPGLQRNLLFTERSTSYLILLDEIIEDVPPQLKLIVVLGLQYAVLAKKLNGVNDEICAELRVEMLCLLEGWTASSNPGAALIRDASRKGKMKPAKSILCSFTREWMPRINDAENGLGFSSRQCLTYQTALKNSSRESLQPEIQGFLFKRRLAWYLSSPWVYAQWY